MWSHQFSKACTQCIGSSCVQETANCTANQYVECNPVTGSPCALLAGASCDIDWKAKEFVCWGGSNPRAECEPCNYLWPKGGMFCASGLTCVDEPWKPEVGLCTSSCTGPKPAPSAGSCTGP